MFRFLMNVVMFVITFWLLVFLLTVGTSLMTSALLATY